MTILNLTTRIAVACLLLVSSLVVAGAGDFDPSFNRVGFTRDSIAANSTIGAGLAIHSSGEIVTSGHYLDSSTGTQSLFLWRHLTDGTLDTTFGGTGVIYPASPANLIGADSVAIDNLDRIVLVAITSTSFVVYRFNFDGSPDLSFSGTGRVTIPIGTTPFITGVAIQPDNKIVGVGGFVERVSQFVVYRLQETGELDRSFGGTGLIFTQITPGGGTDRATGVALQTDGKIVVAGRARSLVSGSHYDVALARYLPTGALDPDFGSGGKVTLSLLDDDLGRKVVIQPDGKIVVATSVCLDLGGDVYCYPGVARVDDRGELDPSFGAAGWVYTDVGALGGYAYDLALQPDNAIVVVGYRPVIADSNANAILIRYQLDGSLDRTFGVNGVSETNYGYSYNLAGTIRLQSDGQMVVSGITSRGDPSSFSAVTARYLSNAAELSTRALRSMQAIGPSP